ncbi:membrane-targeted effector domain-containing toxin [Pseudomonas sp. 7P_10.2_Bac1]|uniref:membrane-targeted effector domain-containing toxin n=1 Tax=Pseudomonas sp. 7P_10.2_Bac1 TaxID=2971614 RepID=UPI0021C96940|nr:membrane-targeted effector domain-containing toxin [Pseudomonas sp. 7P_10.2_Bac1]MCU1726922.1 membrane-targeted effector domain-containing toxin [Pseudomonas sp. 7P_10.2_Bac1]
MTPSDTDIAATQAQQQQCLEQLLAYQNALQPLLNALPDAQQALMDALHAQVQRGFRKHPLPIALDAVHYEENIKLTLLSGSTLFELPKSATPKLLPDLFNNTPWGGEDFEAPNRVYRYSTKTIYDEQGSSRKRTVHLTTVSTPDFERFVDTLIRRPDQCFQQQLDSFWNAKFSPSSSLSRAQWLAEQLGRSLQTEAALRVADQTLDATGKALVERLASPSSDPARTPAIFAVSLKGQDQQADMPLAGVFIVSSKGSTGDVYANTDLGSVVLFTPDAGLDSYLSLQTLDNALRTRLAEPIQNNGLLMTINWQDQARAQGYRQSSLRFSYTPVQGNPFEHCVRSLLTLQEQDIAYGWRQLPRHQTRGKEVYELFNRLAHIGPLLDIRRRMQARSRRYIEANLPVWYRNASATDKQALDGLINAERAANQTLAGLLKALELPTLQAFARAELIRQLAADHPGQAIDPDTIQVRITHSLNPASLAGGAGPDHVPFTDDPQTRPSHTLTLTLSALALRNIDPWDYSFYTIFTGARTTLSASVHLPSGQLIEFDEASLKSLIHRADVSSAYDQLLQKQFLTDGSQVREAWKHAHRTSLACAALTARLDPDSLLPHPRHRGYQWLQAIVEGDTLSSRKTVAGYKVVASSLVIANSAGTRNGYDLNDVLIISLEQRDPVPHVILYAPDAPNGQACKEFANLQALQHFLKQQWDVSSDWRRYVLQRMSKTGQTALTERKKVLHELLFSARSRVRNPFENIHLFAVNTPLHDALYEQKVDTLRRNANHDSTSNDEVAEQSLWNKITFGWDLAMDLVPLLPIAGTLNTLRNVSKVFLLLKQAGSSKSSAQALWSITGAVHRPKVVTRLGALAPLRPSPDLSGLEVQVRRADLNHVRGNMFQSKTSAQQYALLDGRFYLSDVAQGNRFIYPSGTALKTLRYPLVEDAALDNWHVEALPRLRGGMYPLEKGPLETTYRDYELPAADLASLPGVNQTLAGGFNLSQLAQPLQLVTSASVLHIFAIQSRLRRHSATFIRTFHPPTNPLALPLHTLEPEPLFGHLLNQRNGLVIGENHLNPLARQLLIENMPALKRQSLNSIYMEFLNTDLHQGLLDTFNASPTTPMPTLLKERLLWLDSRFNRASNHGYLQLTQEAHAQGVKVMALDTTACSMLIPGDLSPAAAAGTLPEQLNRVSMFNFFAYKKITHDQLTLGPHRWIALVGLAHTCKLQSIPGLAELTGGTSLRLASRLPTLLMRTTRDPGVIILSPLRTHSLSIRCDLLLHIPSSLQTFTVLTRLHSPNLFTIIDSPHGQAVMHCMDAQSRRNDLPVMLDGTQFYIDHPPLGTVSQRRFNTMNDLVDALINELHMVEV